MKILTEHLGFLICVVALLGVVVWPRKPKPGCRCLSCKALRGER